MKKLLTGLFFLGSLSSFAGSLHVEPNDDISLISMDSKIKLNKNINIKPTIQDNLISQGNGLRCIIRVASAENYDRVIKKDKELRINKFDRHEGNNWFYVAFDHDVIRAVVCSGKSANKTTYQEFKDLNSDVFTLIDFDPVIID